MAIYGCKQKRKFYFYFTLVQSLMSSWVNPDDSPKERKARNGRKHAPNMLSDPLTQKPIG